MQLDSKVVIVVAYIRSDLILDIDMGCIVEMGGLPGFCLDISCRDVETRVGTVWTSEYCRDWTWDVEMGY